MGVEECGGQLTGLAIGMSTERALYPSLLLLLFDGRREGRCKPATGNLGLYISKCGLEFAGGCGGGIGEEGGGGESLRLCGCEEGCCEGGW